jgi:hypothetical protein
MKLKRIVLLGIIAPLSIAAMAQNNWGVFGQANLSSSSTDGIGTRLGGSLGVLYDKELGSNLFLQPRLMVSYMENQAKDGKQNDAFFSQCALTMPVLLSYNIGLGSQTSLRLNAGPYVQYAMFGRERTYTINNSGTTSKSLGWWHQDFGKRFTYGLQGGISLEFNKWMGMIDYKYSLRKNLVNSDGHESTVSLGIGYKF